MQRRSRARYLAPIALVAVIAGTYLIVQHGVAGHRATPPRVSHPSRAARRLHRVRTYVVQPGDNLTGIANKTGVTVGALQALNPGIDPNALQTGQRLRLRR